MLVSYVNDVLCLHFDLSHILHLCGFLGTLVVYFLQLFAQNDDAGIYLLNGVTVDTLLIIILCITFIYVNELFSNMVQSYKHSKEVLRDSKLSIQSQRLINISDKIMRSQSIKKKKKQRINNIQTQINKIFDNLEIVDVTL